MINNISLISCAGALPNQQLSILRENNKKTILSTNDNYLPGNRSLWRLDEICQLLPVRSQAPNRGANAGDSATKGMMVAKTRLAY